MAPLLGVLGGMGPAATNSFLNALVERTPARCDQEHLATIVYSDPATPDRSDAILVGGQSPLPRMLRGVEFLDRSGCDLIAIPCNTAHRWYEDLAGASSTPILHIVDAVRAQVERDAPRVSAVGLMATEGTVHADIYQQPLAAAGLDVLELNDLGADNPVMSGIRAVKAGEIDHARACFTKAAQLLVHRGAQGLIFGCTDIVAALDVPDSGVSSVPVWDSAEALAVACLDRIHSVRDDSPYPRGL